MDVHASIFGRLRSTRDQRNRKESNLRRAGLEAAALPLSYRRKRWRGFRRSGKRSATTFPSRVTGNRTRPAALKGRHPYPLEHGPMKYVLRSPTLLGDLFAVGALRFCSSRIGRGGETRTHTFHGLNVVSLPIGVRPFVLDAERRRLQIMPRGDLARDPRADPAGLKPATSRFVARCSVRLSYRSWGVGRGSNSRPRETNRTRTGTHPGHGRALSQEISSGGSCRARGGPGEDRTPACRISPGRSTHTELQVQTRGHEDPGWRRRGSNPRPPACDAGALPT